MAFFATPYTIHFDDTMAYQSHHFLTSFKFQCAARESLLYGDLIFDQPDVPESLEAVHLFTADAYARNLKPAFLGDRLAILLSLEEWGAVSARFCYRVLDRQGEPICAGFQTHVCADPKSGHPIPLPGPLRDAFESIREIEEPLGPRSFRDRVLSGGDQTASLFSPEIRQIAQSYLFDRHPAPRVLRSVPVDVSEPGSSPLLSAPPVPAPTSTTPSAFSRVPPSIPPAGDADVLRKKDIRELDGNCEPEVWVFPGQGAFDAQLLSHRIRQCIEENAQWQVQFDQAATVVRSYIDGDVTAFFSGSAERCKSAVKQNSDLTQFGIYLQSVLGAHLQRPVAQPAILLGHSLGEIAALTVAGSLSLLDGIRVVGERVRAVRQWAPRDGKLAAVMCDRTTIAEEIAVSKLTEIVIAGRNHDGQTIVSGPSAHLRLLCERMRANGIATVDIVSPTAFHHPALKSAASAWRDELRRISFRPPSITVYTPIGRRMIDPADDLATILSSQLVRPFDLQGAIDDLALAGFSRLVDCGSSGVLTRLLRDIAPVSMIVTNATGPQTSPCEANLPRPAPSTPPTKSRPQIAVVSQGCLLPGRATSAEQLYAALMQGRSGIVDLCEIDSNWKRDFFSTTPQADKSTSSLAGIVDDRDIIAPPNVDPHFFESLSRAQKLLCIAVAPCLDIIKRQDRILCLVGATADGFQDQDRIAALRYVGIDPNHPHIVNRLGEQSAAFLDPYNAVRMVLDRLLGPDVPVTLIDAACASSLYSVALGMAALENNEVDVVLAGGVYCPGPGNNCLFSQFGGLTSNDCRPFDASADGVVFSEGAAFVALRRLNDSNRLGQLPLAIVRGVGLSSDGRSPSANVPQSAGQLIAIRRCYEDYGIAPSSISAIEGHGTSTPAGDSTEVQSLTQFFAPHVSAPLPLHSLKGLLGHTGWAAGTAAMIAVTEMLRSKSFPAQATFERPSQALAKAKDVLFVPTKPVALGEGCLGACRIAIDGFGFGGANAHLVLEEFVPALQKELDHDFTSFPSTTTAFPEDELVVVARYETDPEKLGVSDASAGHYGEISRFDRLAIPTPTGKIILPDLADDMDITQRLALHLTDQILSQLPGLTDTLRTHTSLVIALEGKTERASEATLRVLAPRFFQDWNDTPESESILQVYNQSRPSGPYTLQCMMPNVAPGRAALQFNLNGPNFVVDAGAGSLQAALTSASWLLRGGKSSSTQLAIIAAMNANRWPAIVPATSRRGEFATAYAITTRQIATDFGLPVLGSMSEIIEEKLAEVKSPTPLPSLGAEENTKALFELHAPDWVEAPLHSGLAKQEREEQDRCLVIAPADLSLISDLMEVIGHHYSEHLVFLTGPHAPAMAQTFDLANVQAIQLDDESNIEILTNKLDQFSPRLVLAIARPTTWDSATIVREMSGNSLCEALFIAARHLGDSIRSGHTEVWGLFPQAWNSNEDKGLIHPITGPITGMLKAIKREMPESRLGMISHSSGCVTKILHSLAIERSLGNMDEPEIVYDGQRRLVRRLRRLADEHHATEETLSRVLLNRDSVILATGGARGVTALMVETLLQDYGCTVIALGRSPMEQGPADVNSPLAEQEYYAKFVTEHPGVSPVAMKQSFLRAQGSWETYQRVMELSRLPGQIHYMQVDVNDPSAVNHAVANIQAQFARIDLVIHGAGLQFSKRLPDRKLAEFRQTFDIKVGGLANLMDSCQRHFRQLPPVHVLTSAYSIFGNDGQHDYGAANETLDRLCEWVSRKGDSAWTSLAWSAWNGVGMTRGSEYQALAAQRQLALLEPFEGSRIFRRVISGTTQAAINVPLSQAERARYRVRTLPVNSVGPVQRTIELPVPLSTMDYLQHHKTGGFPTLPGAWIVEQMVRAVLRLANKPVRFVTVENIRFRRFVRSMRHQERSFRVIVDATGHGYCAWLVGDIISPSGIPLASDEVFASAMLSVEGSSPSWKRNLPRHFGSDFNDAAVNDPYCNGRQAVQLSGPFDCLQHIVVGENGRCATFSPHVGNSWNDVVPSLLLDASIRVAGMHAVEDALHVPTEIKRVVLPVGVSSRSLDNSSWTIQASNPVVEGDNIRCGRVEVTDDLGSVRMVIEDAVVTTLR